MSTERNVVHATFALKRTYSAPRARVFDAFADFEKKKQWFGSDDPADHTKASMEFRVGGREHAEGSAGGNDFFRFDSVYLDIVENERIIYCYDMDLGGERISASLTTIEFADARDGGTHLKLTEQGAFLDGYDVPGQRKQGTEDLLDALGRNVEEN